MYCKRTDTKKLLYGKYVYSIKFKHKHAWFLDGESGPIVPLIEKITNHFLNDGGVTSLIDILSRLATVDHRRRTGYESFTIYTNDTVFIDAMMTEYAPIVRELCSPRNEQSRQFLLDNPTTILTDWKFVKYKLYIKPLGTDDESIAFDEWARQYNGIHAWSWSYNKRNKGDGIVRVKDDDHLMLCRLYLGDKIRKVEPIYTYTELEQSTIEAKY